MARIIDVPETKRGTFEVRGVVIGCESQNFYTEKKTKNGKDFRMVNFGVRYDDGKTIYIKLTGMPRDKVYFSKRGNDGKTETKPIEWSKRYKFNENGFRLIGVNCGLTKVENDKGQLVNDKKTLTEFDACEYINSNLEDGVSVYVKGNVEYSTYTDKDGNVCRGTNYIPNQISLCKDVDFDSYDDDKNKPVHNFTQTIIYTGIEKEVEDEKATGRFIVSAKIVTYSGIENVEYIITDSKLANLFRKNLKPYNSIECHGKITVTNQVETVTVEDGWGESNDMERQYGSTKPEMIITGAKPATIDKEAYNEKIIDEALRKLNASKNAEEKFADTQETDAPWGTDDGSFEEVEW